MIYAKTSNVVADVHQWPNEILRRAKNYNPRNDAADKVSDDWRCETATQDIGSKTENVKHQCDFKTETKSRRPTKY